MKKAILLSIFLLHLISIKVFPIDNSKNKPEEKKNYMALGGSCSFKDELNNYGMNFKAIHLINDKLGVGINTVICENKWSDYNDNVYQDKSKSGVYLVSDFIVSYYFIGDQIKSKGGLFCDVGFGYQLDKNKTSRQYHNSPSFEINYKSTGLGLNLNLGGSYKLGKGRLYSEIMMGGIILGKYEDIAYYPSNYPLLKDYPNQSEKGVGNGFVFINDGILALNVGYSYSF
jgi:hypothetical protein